MTASRRRLAAAVGLTVTAAMVLIGVAAWLVIQHEQAGDVDRALISAARTADDVDDPPVDIVIFLSRAGRPVEASDRAPGGLMDPAKIEATRRDGVTRFQHRSLGDDRSYRIVTVRRADAAGPFVVQAAYDLRPRAQEAGRLLSGLLLSGAFGLFLVVAVSLGIAHRAVRPLRTALTAQRQFVADAAHELRTPLTVLHTRVQVLERAAQQAGQPDLAADAARIVDDTRRMADLVGDLLTAAELVGPATTPTATERVGRSLHAACAAQPAPSAEPFVDGDEPTARQRTE
ncbi:histidine kinase dimerization/phospho-acceptor domain-containing protein [Pseudofrankia sp. DC12]|uniref:histidine kinase dimerization/phospho-acceptor domain-containing protein n=1 Tax=Pseudofrankia sp. DC12 TaxID=683315 RepID=UPI0005F83F1A|nr:histidine kinase dimerization/phospho-acceptor domain-containing protein [Pseudofrankia sp. DC12]